MKYTPLSFAVNLRPEGVLIDLDSLFGSLAELHDRRDARGLRYALVTVLVFIVLAKLCGEDHLRGIADWVRLRKESLAEALGLAESQAPHATTYSRILNRAVDVEEMEVVVSHFFASQPKAGRSVVVSLDGKTLRGTIPAGKSKGQHLLAAYLPAEGWVMLGRSYTALSRYRDAAAAFKKATELVPGNADLLADYADVLAMAQGRRLAGEPAKVIQQALDADPRNVKALALAGSVAFEAKDYANARGYWERLVAVVPPDSEIARSVRGSIAEATQLERGGAAPAQAQAAARPAQAQAQAQAPAQPTQAQSPAQPAVAGGPRVTGEVTISKELAGKVAPGDTLFVYARAAQGPRVPLALARRAASELPYRFALDDSMAMAPNFKLSGFQQVVVEARVSRSGQATPQSGDLIGQVGPVAPGAEGLKITIDRVQP